MELSPIQQQITFLHVKDMARTRQFYEDKLGFKVARDQGDCIIYRITNGGFLGFCVRDKTDSPPPIIITLITEDVWGWYEALMQKEIFPEAPPRTNSFYGITHFFIRDPDNYHLEVQKFDLPL